MNHQKLKGAADGVLFGLLLSLGSWKLSQPPVWRIITASEWWFGPGPLLIVAGATIAAVGIVAALRRREGFLPLAVRWGLLAVCAGVALWVGVRAAHGRGSPSEISWADDLRRDLAGCNLEDPKEITSLSETVFLATHRAECAKLKQEVSGAEDAGRTEARRGSDFPAISKAEKAFLDKLPTSKFARIEHPEQPGDIKTAIEYGKQVAAKAAQQQREVEQRGNDARGSGRQSVNPTRQWPGQNGGGTRDRGSAPAGDATVSSIVDGGQVSAEVTDAGTTTVPTPGEGSGAGIPVPGGGSGTPSTAATPGQAATEESQRRNAGGASPFETIAGTASCLYLGAPPQLCMKAIEIINKLFGGLFGGDTSTRNEEISKLMGTLGEFAGVTGDFAKFDPSTFEKRFAEFSFRDPQEGLDAFMKLLQGLEKESKNLGLDRDGIHRALKTAKSLQGRYDGVASCVKQLYAHATQLISAAGGGGDLKDTLEALNPKLVQCPHPLEIVTPEQLSQHFQELQLLQGEDLVNCALAIAAARSGIAADKLRQANLLTADHCPVIHALLDRVMPGH